MLVTLDHGNKISELSLYFIYPRHEAEEARNLEMSVGETTEVPRKACCLRPKTRNGHPVRQKTFREQWFSPSQMMWMKPTASPPLAKVEWGTKPLLLSYN